MRAEDFLDGASSTAPMSAEDFLGPNDSGSKPPKQNTGIVGDIGTALKRGVLQMPGMATGLADIAAAPVSIATGVNRPVSRAADWIGEQTGFQPGKWAEAAGAEYSPEMQQAQQNVEQAKGFFPTLGAVAQNPRVAAQVVAESLPSTIAGGLVARGAMGAVAGAEKLAALHTAAGSADAAVANAARRGLLKSGAIAAGIGEGAVTAGQQMAQTGYDVDPALAAGAAIGAGVGTGIIGGLSGRLASSALGRKLGLSDIETSMAAGTLGENAGKAGAAGFARRIGAGAIQEGLLEEAPQSYQEQVWQNIAAGKPATEGAAEAAALGAVAGGVMGAGVNIASGPLSKAVAAAPGAGVPPSVPVDDGRQTLAPTADIVAGKGTIPQPIPQFTAPPQPVTGGAPLEQTPTAMPVPQEIQNAPAAPGSPSPVSAAEPLPSAKQAESAGAPIQPPQGPLPSANQTEVAIPSAQGPEAAALPAAAKPSRGIAASLQYPQQVTEGGGPLAQQSADMPLGRFGSRQRTADIQLKKSEPTPAIPVAESIAPAPEAGDGKVAIAQRGVASELKSSRGIAGALVTPQQPTFGGAPLEQSPVAMPLGEFGKRVPVASRQTPPDAPQQPLSGAGERQTVDRLQSAYNEAKAKLDAIGPEPRKPSPERQAFGTKGKAGAPADEVAKYEASVKAYVSWKAKYNRLKKAEVEASNALFAAKKAEPQPKPRQQPKTLNDAEIAVSDQKATSDLLGYMKAVRDASNLDEARGAWRSSFAGNHAETIAAGDITRSDYEKLGNLIDRGGITSVRAAEMIDSAVEAGILDAKVAEYMKEKSLPTKRPATVNQQPSPIMRRDDLVGAIMRVTGGDGIASNMALTIAGDTAGRGLSKLRGLFTNRGTIDLGEVATRLREDEGFDVRDGEHLSELIRAASFGDTAVSMERAERDQDAAEEKRHRDYIRQNAKKLKIKSVAVKFTDLEQRVIAALTRRHERAVELLDERAKKRFDAALEESYSLLPEDVVDAVLVDVNGRGLKTLEFWKEATKLLRYMVADARAQKEQEAFDAIEGAEPDWLKDDDGRGNQPAGGRGEVDRVDEEAGGEADEIARDDAARKHGFSSIGWTEGRGPLGAGKWMASSDGVSSNLHSTYDAAAKELRDFVDSSERAKAEERRIEVAMSLAAKKVKAGENPSFAEWQAAFPQLKNGHRYLRQPEISQFLIDHLGFKRNAIRAGLGNAAGTLTSDSGAKYPIVYFNKIADAIAETSGSRPTLALAAQTPEEIAAAEIAAKKAAHDELIAKAAAARKEKAAQDKAEKDRRAAEVLKEREAAKKAEVDKAAEEFALGQVAPEPVVKKVTTEEAAGQKDIFAAPAAVAKQPDENERIRDLVSKTSIANYGDVFTLAGDRNSSVRQEIMSAILGKKATKAESGVTAIRDALWKLAGATSGTTASKDDALRDWIAGNRASGQVQDLRFSQESSQDNQPAFYSQLSGAIASARVTSQPAEQWKAWINGNAGNLGIKKDEIEWSGVNDWLDMMSGGARNAASVEKEYGADSPFAALWKSANPAKITKQQVLDYLSGNGVRVEDVVKGSIPKSRFDVVDDEGRTLETFDTKNDAESWLSENAERYADWNPVVQERIGLVSVAAQDTAKFSGYWQDSYKGGIPGTYREILVTLPEKQDTPLYNTLSARYGKRGRSLYLALTKEEKDLVDAESAKLKVAGQSSFKSNHWDEPNVLVHIRTDEVIGSDGKRYLRVGEIQSDWGQKGKKEGFKGRSAAEIEADLIKIPDGDPAARPLLDELKSARDGVPQAPFVTDTRAWAALGIKRAIIHAINSGVDGVVFGTGEQNANLYNLSKRVNEVSWRTRKGNKNATIELKNGDQLTFHLDKSGKVISVEGTGENQYNGKRFDEVIGKDVADKVMSDEDGVMSGEGLNIGGLGMRAFYDQIIPSVANDVLKKVGGGKIAAIRIDGTDYGKTGRTEEKAKYAALVTQPGFTITPQMRAKIQSQGVPLFSFAGQQSATADRFQLDRAKQLLADGANANSVRQQTGWFKGVDGKWRYEIDDSGASLKAHGFGFGELLDALGKNLTLADVLDHPALFAAYPSIARSSVEAIDEKSQNNGELVTNKDGGFTIRVNAGIGEAKALSVMLHEIQHGIQNVEGFASGGNVKDVAKLQQFKDAQRQAEQLERETGAYIAPNYGLYRLLAGEVESRNVQQRQNFPADKRRLSDPLGTQDVAPEDVIVVFNGKDAKDAPAPANTTRASAMAAVGASPADAAVFDMASEGRSAQEILAFLSKASRRPFNRVLAAALSRIGVSSTVSVDPVAGWRNNMGRNGAKFAASYSPKTDTVALYTPREAERHALHEFVHAASLKAIARGGPAARQMQSIFDYVQRTGTMSDQYGMGNFSRFPNETDAQFNKRALDEFTAELFTNPQFQVRLKQLPAPSGSKLKSAWDWIVRVIANLLGLKTKAQETALDRALSVGAALLQENAALTMPKGETARYHTTWHGSPHKFYTFDMSKIGTGEGAQAYGHGLYVAEAQDVADSYRKMLQDKGNLVGNEPLDRNNPEHVASMWMSGGRTRQQAIAELREFAAKYKNQPSLEAAAILESGADVRPYQKGGSLYKVDLPAEAVARMLDWDKKLSEQPAVLNKLYGAQEAKRKGLLRSVPEIDGSIPYGEYMAKYGSVLDEAARIGYPKDITGRDLYTLLGAAPQIQMPSVGVTNARGKENAEASRKLLAVGIPGIRYLDQQSRSGGKATSNFVLFDDKLARIIEVNGVETGVQPWQPGEWEAAQNGERFSREQPFSGREVAAAPEDPDIRYSLATNWQQSPVAPGNLYQAAKKKASSLLTPERLDKVIYETQDKFIDLRRIRDHIKEIGGTITDLNDAYLGEELYHKRLAYRTEQFLKEELQPFFADMKARGVEMPELEKFLHARHAPEANAEMAKRNPNQKQIDAGRQKSSATVRALELNLQTAKARGLATAAIEKALTDAQAELVRWNGAQAFKGTEAERLSLSGMSNADASALMASLTPAQRADMDALAARVDAINEGTLQTLERYGLMDKAALNTWRKTYQHYVPLHRDEAHPDSASHPIGQGFNVRGDASKRRTGSNQEVTNIFSHIAMQREAALTRGEKNRVMQKLYLMARQNPIADIWSVGKVPMIDTIDKATGFVRSVPDPQYKDKPNVITLRIGGKDVAIVMNEYNPQALRLAQSIKNLDVDDLHYLIPVVGKATRLFASINTQYNPIFGLINFARDVLTAALNLSTTAIAGKKKEVFKDTMSILGDIIKNKGRMPTAGKWAPIYKEFNEVGGTTGYRDLFLTAEDRSKAVTDEIKALDRGKISQAAHAVAGWLSDYNEAMENATRLAAYKAAIDNGMSKERAASLAKNLTVNFNRKGRQTRELGALYAFFNAAVQGTARMAQTLSGPAGKKIMLGGVLAGAASAMAGIAAMGGGDGEDDEWSKIPEFVKERSFIIPAGKDKYIAIPMPLGFHFLPNIGRLMVEMAVYKDKTLGKQMASLFTVLADAFNPLGGSAPPMQIIAPTVMDPFIALAQNKDWTGKPIYVENFNSLNPQPGAARAKDSATPIAKGMADIINSVTGGTKYVPGAWSPTPDQIDYVIGQLTGGVGRELGKLSSTIAAPFSGDELPAHKIPLLGRLYGSTAGATGQAGKFYENIKRANEVENELKGRRKDGISADDYLQDNPKAVELAARGNAAERQIRALRQMRSRIVEVGGDDAASKARQINERMATVMRSFNMQTERMQ